MNYDRGAATFLVLSGCLLLLGAHPAFPSDLQTFKQCISTAGSGSACSLDPKPNGQPYIIGDGPGTDSGTLVVQRSVNVYGWNVTLQRRPARWNGWGWDYFQGPLIKTEAYAGYPSIYYFTLDGNRAANPVNGNTFYVGEIEFQSGGTVTSALFRNSPRISLAVGGDYVTLQYSIIEWAWQIGAWVGSSSYRFTAYNNTFRDNGANAVLFAGTDGYITYNTFLRNHRGCPYSSNGGQLLIDPAANTVLVLRNVVADGPAYCDYPNSSWWAEGIEAYGYNLTIESNTVTNNGGHGIQLGGAYLARVTNTDPATYVRWNNRRGSGFSGIWVGNAVGSNAYITIDQAIAVDGHYAGIAFQNQAYGSSATNNCVRGNTVGVYICPGCSIYTYNNQTQGCGPP